MAGTRKYGWMGKRRVYSASSIKTALNCWLQVFYDKIHTPKLKIPTHIEYVRGNILHDLMPQFYKADGTPKYSLYSKKKAKFLLIEENKEILNEIAGDVLEEIRSRGKMRKPEKLDMIVNYLAQKYGSEPITLTTNEIIIDEDGKRKKKVKLILGESFANIASYKFAQALKEGKFRNMDIDFSGLERFDENKKEIIGKLCGGIYNTAKAVYKKYYKDEPPIFSEKKITFSVMANGILLNYIAILDEIRYPLTIRDHKSSYKVPEKGCLKLNNDLQFSLYPIALSMGCSLDKEFALKCGATEDDFKDLQQDPLALLPKINIEHHHMRSGIVTPVNPKSKSDFYRIVNTTFEIERKIAEYQKGEKHPFEIFPSKWGIDKFNSNAEGCEHCDYRWYHEEDRKLYDAGKSVKPCESIQSLFPGFIYPEITPSEQMRIRFPRKGKTDIETIIQPLA